MDIIQAIEKRISCRAFTDQQVEQEKFDALVEEATRINEETGLHFQIFGPRADGTVINMSDKMFAGNPPCYAALVAKKDPVEEIRRLTGGRGVDLAVECSGVEVCANQAIEELIRGGTLVQVAYGKSGYMNLNMSLLCDKEITIKTVFRYRHIYPMAIKAVADGKINLKGIVTNVFDFDDIQNAMDQSVHDKANIVKSVVKIAK